MWTFIGESGRKTRWLKVNERLIRSIIHVSDLMARPLNYDYLQFISGDDRGQVDSVSLIAWKQKFVLIWFW